MAGVLLHAKIIDNTVTDGTDQSHFTVHHHSCSAVVHDRTEYLKNVSSGTVDPGDETINPGYAMAGVFTEAAKALNGAPAVAGIPCNTFHAPVIYDVFARTVNGRNLPIRTIHMLNEATGLIDQRLGRAPGSGGKGEKIGILCTIGTRDSGVYDRLLTAAGYVPFYLPPEEHAEVHEAIYNREWGIKGASPVTAKAVDVVTGKVERLAGEGAAAVILGCTELPIALGGLSHKGTPLVDPVLALARALIREANPARLKPMEP
jgi:aspartate racemase